MFVIQAKTNFTKKITKFAFLFIIKLNRMKRILILAITFSIFASGFAQYNDFPIRNFDMTKINLEQLKFGVKISPSISWLNITHNEAIAGGATMKLGVGLTAHYEINEILAVVSAINYNSIGGYMADSISFKDINSKDYFKTNYQLIEVPLGLKIKTPTVNKYNYYLQGGVTTSFVLSANQKRYGVNGKVIDNSDMFKDYTYPTNVGYFAGLGMRYSLTDILKIFVEVNYKHALTTISNAESYVNMNKNNYSEPIYIIPANMEFSFGFEF